MPSKRIASASRALRHWPGVAGEVRVLPAGHINDTYVVGERHILQRINRLVFPQPEAVMRNLAKVLAHDSRLLVPPIPCDDGKSFAVDANGDYWRLFPYLPAHSFGTLPDALLEAAGAAFGGFLTRFASFDGDLEPAIAGFHDLERYLTALEDAPKTREVAADLRQIEALRTVFRAGSRQQLIHGDCKVNNLLFQPSENAVLAIIDLDTLMFGDPAWDFGDLVRSAFAGSEEAAAARPFSHQRFERLCRGFAAAFPALDDVDRYASAPAYMSFMLAVRFLTDHLRGDIYFKVARRGDNLQRARSQLHLAQRFRDAAPDYVRMVHAIQSGAGIAAASR